MDFSNASQAALEEASDLGWRHGASITLLHVLEPPPAAAPDVRLQPADQLRRAAEERRR